MLNPEHLERQFNAMPMQTYLQEVRRVEAMIKKNPRNAELRHVLGIMLLRTNSYTEAAKSLKLAHKYAPKSPEILKSLTDVLFFHLNDTREALKFYRKWSVVDKDQAAVHILIAACLLREEKPIDALEALDRAEKLDPNDPRVHSMRSEIYTKTGDIDNARQSIERYLENGDDVATASKILTIPGYKPDDALLDKLLAMAEENQHQAGLNQFYANVATAYEKRGEFDAAFGYYRKSNQLLVGKLDRQKHMASFANVREAFTRGFLDEYAGNGDPSPYPIFVVGMPRSGTTLTESILAGHPKVVGKGEMPFFLNRLMDMSLFQVRNPLLASSLPGLKEFLREDGPEHYRKLAERYLEKADFRKASRTYFVDKLPHNFLSVGLIHLTFPNARIIHCRRHPVDGALSCYKTPLKDFHDYTSDLEFLGLYYRQYWELMAYWREVLPGKMLEVHYEDMVANTELVARKMVNHVGLEWDDACLDHTSSKSTVRTASQWQVRQPIYTSSVARWKNYEAHLQPMIKAMGSIVETYESELARLSGEQAIG